MLVSVAQILKLVILLHVVPDGRALPVGGLEFAVFWALFGDLDFAVYVCEFSVNLFLAFRTDAFGFTHYSSTPVIPSTINAKGKSIMDMVTMRSYLRISPTVEADVKRRRAE